MMTVSFWLVKALAAGEKEDGRPNLQNLMTIKTEIPGSKTARPIEDTPLNESQQDPAASARGSPRTGRKNNAKYQLYGGASRAHV